MSDNNNQTNMNNNQTNMNNTTTIKWDNAKLNDEFIRINQDGSFNVKEGAPMMFVIGELVHAFLRQRGHIKRLEEAGDKMVNEGWNEPHLAGLWRQAKEAKP